MKLRDLYSKDITREIQGVIKVDDEHSIAQELDEYIVTEEIANGCLVIWLLWFR